MSDVKKLALCAMVILLGTEAGCRRFTASNCNKPQVYATAQNLPPLQIPAGLDAPNTQAALRIPELKEPEAPRSSEDPCLDAPPRYEVASP